MGHQDWEAWDGQEPPQDFAGRVVEQAMREQRGAGRGRGARIGAGLVLVASMAAAVGMTLHLRGAHERGDVRASAREEVHVGGRALAVLEPGAHVKWDGDAIEQQGGDVFWRVEPGARFTVHTAAADVTVKGTCFHVNVSGVEDTMNRRDAMSGTVGAVMAATAFVGVYEGKVAVSHAGQSVDLTAGQSAQANAQGVRRVGGDGPEGAGAGAAAGAPTEGEQALAQANANLADNVRLYRERLEAIEAEKKKLEKQLGEAQAKLGDAGPQKSEYDLSKEDWKELAKEGEVRFRIPCAGPRDDFSYSPAGLNKLGLAPQDGPALQQALQQSHARAWGVLQPLCSQALGGVDVSHMGMEACFSVLSGIYRGQNGAQYDEDVREAAEIMAGTRPSPAPGAQVDPMLAAYLALAREPQTLESDLAQQIGPDDAERAVFGDEGCWWNASHGAGPREAPPGTPVVTGNGSGVSGQ